MDGRRVAKVVVANDARCIVFCFVYERKILKYFTDVNGNKTSPADEVTHGAKLSHGFEWVNPGATISVDLSLQDPNTAKFLEFLYFT